MAGRARDDDDDDAGVISDINVTPLVDIVLVVLIIFMVTAHAIVGRAIEVNSPETESGGEASSTLALAITKDGKLYLNGDNMADIEQVAAAVRPLVQARPGLQAIITADQAVPHGRVMELVDQVQLAGVKSLAFTVVRKPAE